MGEHGRRDHVAEAMSLGRAPEGVGGPALTDFGSNAERQLEIDRELAEGQDRQCYLYDRVAQGRANEIRAEEQGVRPRQWPSHPLEGQPAFQWCKTGGTFDRATAPWQALNSLSGLGPLGPVLPKACD